MGERHAHRREHLVALAMTKYIVDQFEMVQVTHQGGEGLGGPGGLGDHAFERILKRPAVGQARETIGRGPSLSDGEIA